MKKEGNKFSGALAAAKEKGEDEFVVAGKKYSVKEVEGIIDDLSDEKSFFKALKEMDIESGDEDLDFNEEGIDDDQDIAFETKSTKSNYYDD